MIAHQSLISPASTRLVSLRNKRTRRGSYLKNKSICARIVRLLVKNVQFASQRRELFEDLDALAGGVRVSAEHLNELIKRFPNIDKELIAIELQRQSARQRMQTALVRLDNAFITPLDREDILNLIGQLRAVVDRVADLSQRFRLYRLPNLYPNLSSQSANLLSLAMEV
jgi:uncharacterized protein Yka (UPF0111/DUF47 family)